MTTAGIDYSMNSPAVCIANGSGPDIKSVQFYAYQVKKTLKNSGQFHFTLKAEYGNEIERFIKNALFIIKHLESHMVRKVWIEGYSYASRVSSVFPMAENCAILKYHLHKSGIPFEVIPPSRVKKIATGKGNAKKEDMVKAWLDQGGEDLEKTFNIKADSNPLIDIIDSYYVLKAGLSLE